MKNKNFNFSIFIIVTIFASSLLVSCWNSDGHGDKTYIVATDATLAPMSFMSVGNDMIGFEPDLIRAIADKAKINISLVKVEWAGLFGGLVTKKFDMIISSVTVLDENITSFEDAKNNNVLVGAQIGTTAYYFLEKESSIKTKGYQMYGHAISDLINGKVDAVLGESSGTLFLKNRPLFQEIKIVGEILSNEFYAVVFRKDENQLMAQINSAIKNLIADGTIAQLHKKWDLGQAAQVP